MSYKLQRNVKFLYLTVLEMIVWEYHNGVWFEKTTEYRGVKELRR